MSRYLINGDVADRGKNAVEILLCIYAFMLAAPGTIHMNRGNHESLDMNVCLNSLGLGVLPLTYYTPRATGPVFPRGRGLRHGVWNEVRL